MGNDSASVQIDIKGHQLLASGINAGVIPARFREILDLPNGTTDGKIDIVFADTKSGIAASATTTYDLSGSLTNAVAATAVFAEIVLIAIKNKRTTAQATLTIGPHSSAGFGILGSGKGFWVAAQGSGGGSVVGPGAWYVVYDPTGVPVTATTADILSVVSSAVSGDTNTWDLLILGRSA